jgi:hypothetical protein
MGRERSNVTLNQTERLNTMSTFILIAEGVNLLSGRAREEYAEFVAGWLCFHVAFAKYLNQSFDENVCETYEDASATDFLESLKAAGWKPRRGESMRDFDARIKALPIFTQLGLVDGGVDVIKDGEGPRSTRSRLE